MKEQQILGTFNGVPISQRAIEPEVPELSEEQKEDPNAGARLTWQPSDIEFKK